MDNTKGKNQDALAKENFNLKLRLKQQKKYGQSFDDSDDSVVAPLKSRQESMTSQITVRQPHSIVSSVSATSQKTTSQPKLVEEIVTAAVPVIVAKLDASKDQRIQDLENQVADLSLKLKEVQHIPDNAKNNTKEKKVVKLLQRELEKVLKFLQELASQCDSLDSSSFMNQTGLENNLNLSNNIQVLMKSVREIQDASFQEEAKDNNNDVNEQIHELNTKLRKKEDYFETLKGKTQQYLQTIAKLEKEKFKLIADNEKYKKRYKKHDERIKQKVDQHISQATRILKLSTQELIESKSTD